MSLFGGSSIQESEELARNLNQKHNNGSFICDNVSYVRPDEEFQFEVKKTLKLGKELSHIT